MRFVFLMRDGTGTVLDTLDDNVFEELQTAFSVEENGVPLDLDETNVFVTGPDNLKVDIALMLDYTGSLFHYMREQNPGSEDALQELYSGQRDNPDDGLVAPFLDGLPRSPSWSVALMEYHERQQQSRFIHNFSSSVESRDVAKEDLDLFYIPAADHGASEIFDSVIDACEQIAARDEGALPLDDADVRALIFISDGRDTSSVEAVSTAIQTALDLRVRLYPIGFGENVNTAVLLQMAQETGGHYYAAPDVATLTRLLASDNIVHTGTEGLIIKELKRQIVLTYNTLFQEGSQTYLVRAEYQGLQGSFQRDAVFAGGGDVRAGQLALRTDGIQSDGTAVITVRADYVPRNITQLRLRFLEEDGRVIDVQTAEGGLIDDVEWFDVPDAEAGAPIIPGSTVKLYMSNEANPLPYATFGNILTVTVSGYPPPGGPEEAANETYDFQFWVDNRIYLDPPFTKFFQYPNTLSVGYQASRASEFPVLLEDGFDPDAPGAWDNDGDGTDDFEDPAP
jgi:hypothetical protein